MSFTHLSSMDIDQLLLASLGQQEEIVWSGRPTAPLSALSAPRTNHTTFQTVNKPFRRRDKTATPKNPTPKNRLHPQHTTYGFTPHAIRSAPNPATPGAGENPHPADTAPPAATANSLSPQKLPPQKHISVQQAPMGGKQNHLSPRWSPSERIQTQNIITIQKAP